MWKGSCSDITYKICCLHLVIGEGGGGGGRDQINNPHKFLIMQIFSSSFIVFPEHYEFPIGTSVNGSSPTGNCSNVSMDETITTCLQPNSSVLFDGCVPTLTGLDCNMWASQLLTLQSTRSLTTMRSLTNVIFNFTDTPGYDRVERVEVVMFNCPQWGIGTTTIELNGATARGQVFDIFSLTSVSSLTSCESLVRVCLSANVSRPVIRLQFTLDQDSDWLHLAEVNFYARGSTCPPNIIFTPPPPMTTPSGTPCSCIDCPRIHAKIPHGWA